MTVWLRSATIGTIVCLIVLPAAHAQETLLPPPSIDRVHGSMLASAAASRQISE